MSPDDFKQRIYRMEIICDMDIFEETHKFIECKDCIGTGAWNNPSCECPHCGGKGGFYEYKKRCKRRTIKKKHFKELLANKIRLVEAHYLTPGSCRWG